MVLDASAAIELILNTAAGRRLAKRLADESVAIHAPHLIDVEIAQVLRRYVAHKAFPEARASLALEHWRSLQIARYPHEPFLGRIWHLRDNFSAYDAMYVSLAQALSTVLLTSDQKLARAPNVGAQIELI
jgi:predicted nucleic acid-binding protein